MNPLLNIYVSKQFSDQVLMANYIWNRFKENDDVEYPENVSLAIDVNRKMEEFIKNSAVYTRSRNRLKPCFSKHSISVVGIFYDHFLATNWSEYSEAPLDVTLKETYTKIIDNAPLMSFKYKKYVPKLFTKGYLSNLKSVAGVHQFMLLLAKRDNFPSNLDASFEDLIKNYSDFKNDFEEFIVEFSKFISEEIPVNEKVNISMNNKNNMKYAYVYVA